MAAAPRSFGTTAAERRVAWWAAAAAVLLLFGAACAGDDEQVLDDLSAPIEGPDQGDQDRIDLSLVRTDVDCSSEGLGEDDTADFRTAHFVVDGRLGAVCFGDEDPLLIGAWESLAQMTPPGQLADLALFGGFVGDDSGDEETLAFVNVLDDDGFLFQMSVSLPAAEGDPDELLITLAHEFSHVFTAVESELDRSAETVGNCPTYDNGEGCYLAGSLMADWIDAFWAETIDDVDPEHEATAADGQERCDFDGGFFGSYAASNPEEDFGESFGAYVLRVEPRTRGQEDRFAFFDERPGLVEFRDLAAAAGLGPLPFNFDPCGLDE